MYLNKMQLKNKISLSLYLSISQKYLTLNDLSKNLSVTHILIIYIYY